MTEPPTHDASPAPAENGERPIYDFTIDVASDSTHATVVRMVGRDKRVLELGPATGYMSEVLSANGCTVTGIEIDEQMAAEAAKHAERVVVGDLDTLDLAAELGDARFDVIVAADVLEHLKDPLAVLRRLRPLLAEETGYFVVSLPNIAHGSVRLALMEGHFEYRDLGLLDRTHLRFFTRESIEEMFDEAELAIVEVRRQVLNVDASEVGYDSTSVPAETVVALNEDPDARTYQFVLAAYPIADAGMRLLQARLRERQLELEAVRRELDAARAALGGEAQTGLADALAAIAAREGDLRVALIDAHDQVLRRDEEIERLAGAVSRLAAAESELDGLRIANDRLQSELRAAVDRAGQEMAVRDETIRRLRIRLERILASPPARLWNTIGNLPVLKTIRARRSRGYSSAVGDRS